MFVGYLIRVRGMPDLWIYKMETRENPTFKSFLSSLEEKQDKKSIIVKKNVVKSFAIVISNLNREVKPRHRRRPQSRDSIAVIRRGQT
jgi:hypothetical protein